MVTTAPVQSPFQPAKVEPGAASAVRPTTWPTTYRAQMKSLPSGQVRPTGSRVTVPVPLPPGLMVSVPLGERERGQASPVDAQRDRAASAVAGPSGEGRAVGGDRDQGHDGALVVARAVAVAGRPAVAAGRVDGHAARAVATVLDQQHALRHEPERRRARHVAGHRDRAVAAVASPLKPLNVEPGPAVAVSVTTVPPT